jgi:chemotaxis response regulator CheB
MLLVVTGTVELAQKIETAVGDCNGWRMRLVAPRDAREVRAKAHGWQPHVIILDVCAGRSGFRALDDVMTIKRQTTARPAVIVVAPGWSEELQRAAASQGAFDLINLRRRGWQKALRESYEAAEEAWASGALPSVGLASDVVLH